MNGLIYWSLKEIWMLEEYLVIPTVLAILTLHTDRDSDEGRGGCKGSTQNFSGTLMACSCYMEVECGNCSLR